MEIRAGPANRVKQFFSLQINLSGYGLKQRRLKPTLRHSGFRPGAMGRSGKRLKRMGFQSQNEKST